MTGIEAVHCKATFSGFRVVGFWGLGPDGFLFEQRNVFFFFFNRIRSLNTSADTW